MVLQALLTAPLMSRDIFDSILYENYNSFRVSLNKYHKQGYIQMQGKKPYHYSLTEKGKLHAHNPYICREQFANKLNAIVSKNGTDIGMEIAIKYLSGDEAAKKQIEEYLKTLQEHKPEVVETVQRVIEVMPVPEVIEPVDDEYGDQRVLSYEELLQGNELANAKIEELNAEVQRLRNQQLNCNMQIQKMKEKPRESEKNITEAPAKKGVTDDMMMRFELINEWRTKYLNKKFFDLLVHYRPYRIIAASNVKELMRMKWNQDEVAVCDSRTGIKMVKEGFCEELSAKDIQEQGFHLKWLKDGIYVVSEVPGVKRCRIMKKSDYSKCQSLAKKEV
jgi:hypothetical protein